MHPFRHPLARGTAALVAIVLAATTLVACGDDDGDDAAEDTTTTEAAAQVEVSDAWIRPVTDLTASDRSAAYMVITGGSEDDALVAASVPADVAGTVEIHETVAAEEGMSDDSMADASTTTAMGDGAMGEEGSDDGGISGMMEMREVEEIPVPADATVELVPGGFHVMLLDVQRELTPGETIELTLTFEVAGEMTVQAEVREP